MVFIIVSILIAVSMTAAFVHWLGMSWSYDKIFVTLVFLVCAIISPLIVYIIDSSFRPERMALSTIVGRSYSPGHFQTQLISDGKTTTTTMIWIPDTWGFTVKLEHETYSCMVNEYEFNAKNVGESVNALFVSGRITDYTYCNGVVL